MKDRTAAMPTSEHGSDRLTAPRPALICDLRRLGGYPIPVPALETLTQIC